MPHAPISIPYDMIWPLAAVLGVGITTIGFLVVQVCDDIVTAALDREGAFVSDAHKADRVADLIQETADRTRRIETKLTRLLVAQGYEVQTSQPVWAAPGIITVPSRAVSLGDCLTTVPPAWHSAIVVMCAGTPIAHIVPVR